MPTRENKIGLVLAFLLGLSDIAFLATLSGDSGDKPPVWIVVVSVVVGLATLVLVTTPRVIAAVVVPPWLVRPTDGGTE
jgi:hypothetical protein